MRIERVVIRGLRALRSRDDRLIRPDGVSFPVICLRGLTGSGKTTYLEVLTQLWQWFRRCTIERAYSKPTGTPHLAEAELVAALFADLPGPYARMWVAHGKPEPLEEFLTSEPGLVYEFGNGKTFWFPQILEWWDSTLTMAQSGMGDAPNLVYIEAENRYVPTLRRNELVEPRPIASFYPVARYLPEARGPSHLEGIMRNLFLARPERWKDLATAVHQLRPNLELLDRFEETTQRPLFRLTSGEHLTTDRLSAGERSMLINLCMPLRWLGQGGLTLVDEPEQHQHLSLMRGSLAVVQELVVEQFKGQLFVASHAPEVWDHAQLTGRVVDLES